MTTSRMLRSKRKEAREYDLVLRRAAHHNMLLEVDWLNKGTSPAQLRVARLIELLKTAEEQQRTYLTAAEFLPEREAAESRYRAAEDEANEILARYRGSQRVLFHGPPTVAFWVTDWNRVLKDESYGAEIGLISLALSLLPRGLINRLRKCRECGKWFYATTDHNKSCSDNCRNKYASHAEEFKRKRAAYQREYRAKQRERERRSWELLEQDKTKKGRKTQ